MSASTMAAPGLHQRRCVRHPSREAAVRCPACREFFCRECVVEHSGRFLCAACLARAAAPADARRERYARLRRMAAAAAGGLVLWATFHALGSLVAKLPPDVHDGTVWKKVIEE